MADSPVSGGYIRFNIRPLPVSINVTDKEQTIHLRRKYQEHGRES